MTTAKLIQMLIEEKHYDPAQTERLSDKLDALPADIRAPLEAWVLSGKLESPEYGGYTVHGILQKKPAMTEVGAYLTLDWLRRETDQARKALNRMEILRREG